MPMERAKEYIADSVAQNTRRGYQSDYRRFALWCKTLGLHSIPASPESIASYLSYMADTGRKPSTIDRARAAIRMAHETAGLADPTNDRMVRLALKGIRRKLGTAKIKKSPVLTEDVIAMVSVLPENIMGIRDRALILIGFSGAFRRSELVGILLEHIEETPEGIKVLLPRSKTDQDGEGRYVGIKRGSVPATCPVRALRAWLDAAAITSGPVFRRVDRHGNVLEKISAQSVGLIVKRAVKAAGLDPTKYSGHSLRAGFVTQAAIAGATETNIMRQTGHKSHATLQIYIRIADLFKDNPSSMLGL